MFLLFLTSVQNRSIYSVVSTPGVHYYLSNAVGIRASNLDGFNGSLFVVYRFLEFLHLVMIFDSKLCVCKMEILKSHEPKDLALAYSDLRCYMQKFEIFIHIKHTSILPSSLQLHRSPCNNDVHI